MPGVVVDEIHEEREDSEFKENENSGVHNENLVVNGSPRNGLASQSPRNGGTGYTENGVAEPSIEELYDNVCEMQSSEHSPSRQSYGSDGDESRIDSELRHLVGGEMREVEIMEEDEELQKPGNGNDDSPYKTPPSGKSKKGSQSQLESDASGKSSPKGKKEFSCRGLKSQKGTEDTSDSGVENPDLGPFLLKQARDLISSGDNPRRALDLALRAAKSF
nr:protein KINESIN LIGHT CHAIN-RELATED 3-like [Ipomoea batatas]